LPERRNHGYLPPFTSLRKTFGLACGASQLLKEKACSHPIETVAVFWRFIMISEVIQRKPFALLGHNTSSQRTLLVCLLLCVGFLPSRALAQQGTLTDDAYTSTSKANKNFGAGDTVQVSGTTDRGFVKFKLTPSLPPNTIGSHVGKATLKLFVDNVATPGTLEIRPVTTAWAEETLTNASAPSLGAPIGTVTINATNDGKWITIDITQVVKDWLDGVLTNNGLAIVPMDQVSVTLDSKENGTTSHEPRLEIVLNHAATADQATTADSATTVTGVVATGNGGTGLTTSGTAGNFLRSNGANWTSAPLASSDVPDLGALYIKNTTTPQSASNFNISGNGTAGGTLSANLVNATTQYNISGSRVLSLDSFTNIFAGIGAGQNNVASGNTGFSNSFFGSAAGQNNTTGQQNSFFGRLAGTSNTTGNFNSFIGFNAGRFNTTGSADAFLGFHAGLNNTTGSGNTFLGPHAGESNTTENNNTFIGANAQGTPGIANATAIGANAQVNASNTMVLGTNTVTVQVPGNLNVSGTFTGSIPAGSANYVQNTTSQQASSNFNISGNGTAGGTLSANFVNAGTQFNLGGFRILHNEGTSNLFAGIAVGEVNTGSNNAFFGWNAGHANTTGSLNAFFGQGAGQLNTTGQNNAFFGSAAGTNNSTGVRNSFFGSLAGVFNTTGGFNSFFGTQSAFNNTTGVRNAFFGNQSGQSNTSGSSNVIVGDTAGFNNTTGTGNTFVGQNAGASNTAENQNTFVGINANGVAGITNATAIGANSLVTTSNTMVLATNSVTVQVPGNLNVSGTFTGSIPAGSANYIQNTTSQQASSNFNISGNGTAGGTLSANFVNAGTQFNLGGFRILHNEGISNLFAGIAVGEVNTGSNNAFFGFNAGANNTTGSSNSFFGQTAGLSNTTGDNNAFFGTSAGAGNTTARFNSIFGAFAGLMNATSEHNSFFGFEAGRNTTGGFNSFFGSQSGKNNTTGNSNSFFGPIAGISNTTGNQNAFFGSFSGQANTSGFANSFFGAQAGTNNTTGVNNAIFGALSGSVNTTGSSNAFFGMDAGGTNTTGNGNTFVGQSSGRSNTTENENTFVGSHANGAASINNSTAIGANATVTQSDSVILGNNAKVGIGTSAPKEKLEVQSGNIFVGSPGQGIILKSPDGNTCRVLTIDNAGALTLLAITCP
jgi:hypothetical protein